MNSKKAFSLIELSIVILIIGILIAGVTQGSRLVGQMRLASARALTQSSPASSIKDLSLWLESTSEKSILNSNSSYDVEEGDKVQTWNDINPQTITKINFAQGTTANQPIYTLASGTINNLPTVKFDGITTGGNGDYLQNAVTPLGAIAQANQVTIFIVEKVMNSSDNSTFMMTPDVGTNRINFHSPETNNFRWEFGNAGAGTYRISVATPSGFVGNPKIVTLIRKPTNIGIIRVNGVEVLNATHSADLTALTANAKLDLGSISDNMGYSINAYIGELIIFRRSLKSDEITDIEKYLSTKWAIKLN